MERHKKFVRIVLVYAKTSALNAARRPFEAVKIIMNRVEMKSRSSALCRSNTTVFL